MNVAAQPVFMIDDLVDKYVRLRAKIKEKDDAHKEAMKPMREMQERLNGLILQHLQRNNEESAKTKFGTVYKINRKSATIADQSEFRRHVIGSQDFDLVDWRANALAVEKFIEENNTVPPGVNYRVYVEAGVRKA